MKNSSLTGIILVLAACLCWGLIFVIPHYLDNFSPIEVALGRYFFYGLAALAIVLIKEKHILRTVSSKLWITAFGYTLVMNILYYTSLIIGFRYASASVTALMMGLAPITISFYGNMKEKAFDFKTLLIPSLALTIGLLLVNIPAFDQDSERSTSEYLLGLACGLFSLGAWTWFVVANSSFLHRNPSLSPARWSNIMGVATLVWVVIIVSGLSLTVGKAEHWERYTNPTSDLHNFILGTALLGLACSWLGFYLWYRANDYLPVSLAGQLTIFETIFGLVFVYIAEQRLPNTIELAGIVVMLAGIIMGVNMLSKSESMRSIES